MIVVTPAKVRLDKNEKDPKKAKTASESHASLSENFDVYFRRKFFPLRDIQSFHVSHTEGCLLSVLTRTLFEPQNTNAK